MGTLELMLTNPQPKYSVLCASLAKAVMGYADRKGVPVKMVSVMLFRKGEEPEGATFESPAVDTGKRSEGQVYQGLLEASLLSLKSAMWTQRPSIDWEHLGVCIETSDGYSVTGTTENVKN